MRSKESKEKRIIDRFQLYVKTAGSGIFGRSGREKLLGTKRIYGGKGDEATKNTFWYRTRNKVRTALEDLRLFIESADKRNVNQVVTVETLEPVVHALLGLPITYEELPDRKRAEIAELFIKRGFEYLSAKSSNHVTLPHKRTIEEALDLSSYLVRSFRGEK